MKKNILYLPILFSFGANAETLVTPTYEIQIGLCPEGYVSCDTIPFDVKNIHTGKESSYVGGTLHTLCTDGETPCRFQGYQFTGDTVTLVVNDADAQSILIEEGSWSE